MNRKLTLMILVLALTYSLYGQEKVNRTWFISERDLNIELPEVIERDIAHSVEIIRQFSDDKEAMLLKRAEAVYPNKEEIPIHRLPPISDSPVAINEPVWWQDRFKDVRDAYAVTAAAVSYYHELSRRLRREPTFAGDNQMPRTRLKYLGSIKHYDEYVHGGRKFSNVYVIVLKLEWSQHCGMTCGRGFARKKEVVLDAEGNVLELFLDRQENMKYWVS